MRPPELLRLSATDLLHGYRSRAFSPVEVVTALETHTIALEPRINAFLSLHFEEAHRQASESERRWSNGTPIGSLDGVPVSIKDHVAVSGWVTRNGTVTTDPANVAVEDAPATARLREAGAILFGKTTMPEFGWKGSGNSALSGVTRNPWNLRKTPGGSSSGAAAAVASGLGPMAVGSDGGGSVRIPCSYSGIFGIKPSGGRIPFWPHSQNHSLTHLGPMTRTVSDAALMLSVLARPDSRDWSSLPAGPIDYNIGLETLPPEIKICFSMDMGFARVDQAVAEVIQNVIEALRRDGLNAQDCDPGFRNPNPWFHTLFQAGMASGARNLDEGQLAKLDHGLQQLILKGRRLSALDYTAAMSERVLLGSHMRQFSETWTVLLSPVCCTPAFDANLSVPPGYSEECHLSCFLTHPFNATLQPAASVPVGFTADGLPVGLQIVGPMFGDDIVMRIARRIEKMVAIDQWPAIDPLAEPQNKPVSRR